MDRVATTGGAGAMFAPTLAMKAVADDLNRFGGSGSPQDGRSADRTTHFAGGCTTQMPPAWGSLGSSVMRRGAARRLELGRSP